jgi:hypothetical protein
MKADKAKIKNRIEWVFRIAALLTLLTSTTVPDIRHTIVGMWKAGKHYNETEKRLHHTEIQNRMSYEVDRILTDRYDSLWYEIEVGEEQLDVHIRTTNEGALLGFVSEWWISYPVYTDTDGMKYITPHDSETHERRGTYLKLK